MSVEFKPDYPDHREEPARFIETVSLPVSRKRDSDSSVLDRAKFDILIFKPEGRQAGGLSVGEVRDYLREFGNVSVYDAGFRLPYYGSSTDNIGQDWLGIALDQGRRATASELLPERLGAPVRYLLDLPAPGRIFGAVEIDTNHERVVAEKRSEAPRERLQIQPGRDRLVANQAFGQLRDLVRFSLDFYANRFRLLANRSSETERSKEPASRTYDRALDTLERNKAEIPKVVYSEVTRGRQGCPKGRRHRGEGARPTRCPARTPRHGWYHGPGAEPRTGARCLVPSECKRQIATTRQDPRDIRARHDRRRFRRRAPTVPLAAGTLRGPFCPTRTGRPLTVSRSVPSSSRWSARFDP